MALALAELEVVEQVDLVVEQMVVLTLVAVVEQIGILVLEVKVVQEWS